MDSDETRRAFGERLAAARMEAGMTGEAVGFALGKRGGRKTVSQWETGRALPDAMTLRQLCRLFGCSADDLLWDRHEKLYPGAPPFSPALLQRIRTLPDALRPSLEAVIKNVLDGLESARSPAGAQPPGTQAKPRRAA